MDGSMTALVLFVLAVAVCCAAVFPAVFQLDSIPDSFKGWALVRRGRFIFLWAAVLLPMAAVLAALSLWALMPHQ